MLAPHSREPAAAITANGLQSIKPDQLGALHTETAGQIQPAGRRHVDPVVVFRARCEARARLYGEGELELHEAVDVLQADAVATGLVALIGQDAVQAIMGGAFEPVRKRAQRLQPVAIVDDSPPLQPRDPAAATVEALRYLVRQGDPGALRAWLAKRPRAEYEALKRLLVPS
jgi:hypothetical protein